VSGTSNGFWKLMSHSSTGGIDLRTLHPSRMVLAARGRGRVRLQHATQGWCPPVPVFRRLGIRTQTEIDHERYALKALRGDFKKIKGDGHDKPAEALRAVRA
jgi:hypothetical protein